MNNDLFWIVVIVLLVSAAFGAADADAAEAVVRTVTQPRGLNDLELYLIGAVLILVVIICASLWYQAGDTLIESYSAPQEPTEAKYKVYPWSSLWYAARWVNHDWLDIEGFSSEKDAKKFLNRYIKKKAEEAKRKPAHFSSDGSPVTNPSNP